MLSIGYVGCEAFDLVLYIGRTLTKLNYRVLIIDLSDTGSLLHTIKHGMGLDSKEDIINYRDINYTRKIPSTDELTMFQGGVIFMVYGYHYMENLPFECSMVNVVTNTYPHVINKVNEFVKQSTLKIKNCKLLIRDIVTLDDVDRVKKAISFPYDNLDINYLYLEMNDYESSVECQMSQIVRFTKISSRMEKYIIGQIRNMFPQLKFTKIKRALVAARRGV